MTPTPPDKELEAAIHHVAFLKTFWKTNHNASKSIKSCLVLFDALTAEREAHAKTREELGKAVNNNADAFVEEYVQVEKLTARVTALTEALDKTWHHGTPDVAAGHQERFWCVCTGVNGKLFHRLLLYCNAHVMPLSDDAYEVPKTAVPVGDDGDYAWTGWHETSCEQCDTLWCFNHEVVAWMRLPKYAALHPQPDRSESEGKAL